MGDVGGVGVSRGKGPMSDLFVLLFHNFFFVQARLQGLLCKLTIFKHDAQNISHGF